MSMKGLFNRTCTIERATPAVDTGGTVSLTWSTVASNVPCALQQAENESRQDASGEKLDSTAVLYLPKDTDIRPCLTDGHADRVTIASNSYLVASVADERAGREHLRIAHIQRYV